MSGQLNNSSMPSNLGILQGRPSTFAERGVCVPFTTPALTQARVRTDYADRLECLLPGFSGGKGTFIFAWRTVPEIVRITLHDRSLHREIMERKANSPDGIRHASLVVASRGFAGLAAQDRAQELLEAERQMAVTCNFLIMVELLRAAGFAVSSLIKGGLDNTSSRQMARNALEKVAERLKMAPDTLYSRVEVLSGELAPVGFAQAPKPGRLRGLLHRLQWFRDDLSRWSRVEGSEAEQLAKFLVEYAGQTLTLATERLTAIDPKLAKINDLVVSEAQADDLRKSISRLSWLLDGWEYICQLWEDSREEPDDMQRLAVCEMARIAPSIPVEELVVNDNFDEELLGSVQRRWVRPNQDWRTGGLDYDMVRRIESVKAKMS